MDPDKDISAFLHLQTLQSMFCQQRRLNLTARHVDPQQKQRKASPDSMPV